MESVSLGEMLTLDKASGKISEEMAFQLRPKWGEAPSLAECRSKAPQTVGTARAVAQGQPVQGSEREPAWRAVSRLGSGTGDNQERMLKK